MTSSHDHILNFKCLSPSQKTLLRQCRIKDFSELITTSPSELSRRSKRPLSEVEEIVEKVCQEHWASSLLVQRLDKIEDNRITTGDAHLDKALGGGFRTGMIWEITGESASGKTQFALQLSLLVQLRSLLGGLLGAACYITTHTKLVTKRLSQLIDEHPLLSCSICSLSDVHTTFAPNVELLTRSLTQGLRSLQRQLSCDDERKPVKLVIIDSLSSLFQSTGKASTSGLVERSKALTEVSHILHTIAARDNIVVVVVNDVTDVFTDIHTASFEAGGDVLYRDQARWFNSAHSLPGEGSKEASLGLVWANQVNARIILSRTHRRKYLEDSEQGGEAKRRRLEDARSGTSNFANYAHEEPDIQPALIRRLSVIFSSVSEPNSADFIVTQAGISAVVGTGANGYSMQDSLLQPQSSESSANKLHVIQEEPAIIQIEEGQHEDDMPSASAEFTTALSVELHHAPNAPSDPEAEVIPSTFPEEVDELDVDEAYWEEFDDLADPLLRTEPDVSDNHVKGTSSEQ